MRSVELFFISLSLSSGQKHTGSSPITIATHVPQSKSTQKAKHRHVQNSTVSLSSQTDKTVEFPHRLYGPSLENEQRGHGIEPTTIALLT